KSLGYDFVWDDPYVIGPHLDVKGWQDVAKLWNTPFDLLLKDEGFQRTYFRPATLFSLAFDRATSGENPRGFHAQNLLWYAPACHALSPPGPLREGARALRRAAPPARAMASGATDPPRRSRADERGGRRGRAALSGIARGSAGTDAAPHAQPGPGGGATTPDQ